MNRMKLIQFVLKLVCFCLNLQPLRVDAVVFQHHDCLTFFLRLRRRFLSSSRSCLSDDFRLFFFLRRLSASESEELELSELDEESDEESRDFFFFLADFDISAGFKSNKSRLNSELYCCTFSGRTAAY